MERLTPQEEKLLKELAKEALIKDIADLLKECNDISILDLILRLLKKSK
jgi:hypothetical protein